MWHASSSRCTPVSGETITKLVRQNYKPQSPEPYVHEVVQCRTDKTCQKSKPEDYWNTNFYRRQDNLQKGFYTCLTEPYKPIGGDVILDPYELVQSALPSVLDKKTRLPVRRGTIFESGPERVKTEDQSDKDSSLASGDLLDSCPSAGYDDIKRLLRESKDRIVSVRAGMPYEDHVRATEEQGFNDMLASRTDDTEMVLQSVSSLCMPIPSQNSDSTSRQSSGRSVVRSPDRVFNKANKMFSICSDMRSPSPLRDAPGRQSFLRPPSSLRGASKHNKLSLIGCSSGITHSMHKRERLFRDHLMYLRSIYTMLTALHNMKVRDIRSKVPLSKDVIDKYQRENVRDREEDRLLSRGPPVLLPKIGRNRRESVQAEQEEQSGRPTMSVFGVAKRLNMMDAANKNVFGRRKSRNAATLSLEQKPPAVETWEDLLNVQRQEYIEPKENNPINFNFGVIAKFMRWVRKSKMAGAMEEKKGAIETWEDLLNVQRQEYKDDTLSFQVGIVAKFMRWYRIASVTPIHMGAVPDQKQLSHLQEVSERAQEKQDHKVEQQASHVQQAGGQITQAERVKKLPIWQQVAQEKSTVFHDDSEEREPNPDTTIQRFRKNIYKLKKSVEKENTAELEKMIRERVANFRLKFGTLNSGECSCLFEEQKVKIQDVNDNVNKSHLENFDVQPSKWFEELREKTSALVFTHNQPQIVEIISKLQTHAHMDNKTVSYAKAKLCLLMMSLPAYDICQIYVQRALKFIFENILLGQESQFTEWLNHRKIPYVLMTDPLPSRFGAVSPFKDN